MALHKMRPLRPNMPNQLHNHAALRAKASRGPIASALNPSKAQSQAKATGPLPPNKGEQGPPCRGLGDWSPIYPYSPTKGLVGPGLPARGLGVSPILAYIPNK